MTQTTLSTLTSKITKKSSKEDKNLMWTNKTLELQKQSYQTNYEALEPDPFATSEMN